MRAEVRETIESIFPFSSELYYYTVDGVRNTVHVPPGSADKPDNWTIYLLERLTEIENEVGLSPELLRLKNGLLRINKKPIELERTFTAIHCYHLCRQGRYAEFIEAQGVLQGQLTPENFQNLQETVQDIEGSDLDSQAVLAALIVYSDLGKSPETRKLAKELGVDATLDTDDLMLAILQLSDENIGKIIPSYLNLSATAKQMLKEAYPLMTICFGHIFFTEGNSKAFLDIQARLEAMQLSGISPQRRKHLLNLVFAAQFFDGAGAQGQQYIYGSRTCTNDFYRGYMLMFTMLQQLHTQSADAIFVDYLTQRAQWMGLDRSQFITQEDFDVVLRLGCTLRLFASDTDRTTAQALREAYYTLSPADQALLAGELSFKPNQGLNLFTHAPHYVATGAQNICRNEPGTPLRAEDMQNIFNYSLVLARLIKKLRTQYKAIIQDPVLPLNFGGVAFLARDPAIVRDPYAVDLADLLRKEPILPKETVLRIEMAARNLIGQSILRYQLKKAAKKEQEATLENAEITGMKITTT